MGVLRLDTADIFGRRDLLAGAARLEQLEGLLVALAEVGTLERVELARLTLGGGALAQRALLALLGFLSLHLVAVLVNHLNRGLALVRALKAGSLRGDLVLGAQLLDRQVVVLGDGLKELILHNSQRILNHIGNCLGEGHLCFVCPTGTA